jgi:hexosaminidase
LTTRWLSDGKTDPQWIMIDLGSSQKINRVKLLWEKSYAKRYALQVSDDELSWTDIYQTSTGKGGTEDLTNLSGRGRYIRLSATERVTRYGYSLYEFEVFGPDQPAN